ncbi:hypothetical protein AMECASPLE_006364 [Ameca splendens]|uniref:Uncharacterized protein n=1 Tax=Ameca splendens TaxID=208324 RepID=A0ABV0XCF5_9TELE
MGLPKQNRNFFKTRTRPSSSNGTLLRKLAVIGRFGGALSVAFQAAGAYSKAGVSAPPLGVFVPSPRFPHSPTEQKIRAAFWGAASSGLTLSPTVAFLMEIGENPTPANRSPRGGERRKTEGIGISSREGE